MHRRREKGTSNVRDRSEGLNRRSTRPNTTWNEGWIRFRLRRLEPETSLINEWYIKLGKNKVTQANVPAWKITFSRWWRGREGWKRERGRWKWRGYKARCRRKEEGVEIRNVIKVPPFDHVFDSFPIHGYALLRFFLYPRFFDYSSFSSATPGTLLFALEIFCGTRMGQGNQTATTLSLPLPPPPSFFSPFFFLSFI